VVSNCMATGSRRVVTMGFRGIASVALAGSAVPRLSLGRRYNRPGSAGVPIAPLPSHYPGPRVGGRDSEAARGGRRPGCHAQHTGVLHAAGGGPGLRRLIGAERRRRARRAWLRANALVAVGAILFVLYSEISGSANATQVAAYVVSGVGFLGGVIPRDGFNVRGLNTAATLWCSAAARVLAASGHLAFAVIETAGSQAELSGLCAGRAVASLGDGGEQLRRER
jgi:MgtC family